MAERNATRPPTIRTGWGRSTADISDEGLVMVARPRTLDSRAIVLGLSLDSQLRVRRIALTAPARETVTP